MAERQLPAGGAYLQELKPQPEEVIKLRDELLKRLKDKPEEQLIALRARRREVLALQNSA